MKQKDLITPEELAEIKSHAARDAVKAFLELIHKNGKPEAVELATAETQERLEQLGFKTQEEHRDALEQVKAALEKMGVKVTIKSQAESQVLRAAVAAHGKETEH